MKATDQPHPGALVLAALLLPFYLNDAANILIDHPATWLACDYGVRILIIGSVWILARKRIVPHDFLGRPETSALSTGAWTVATFLLGLFIVTGPGRSLLALWPQTHVAASPAITDPVQRALDLSFGLVLVALSEELVFRAIALRVYATALRSGAAALVVSSILFGAAHWSLGVGAVLQTALAGAVLGVCTLRCRSVWPAFAAHYFIDLAAFW